MVADQLKEIRDRSREAAHRTGRDPNDVTLIAVSKGQPDAAIMAAYDAGQRHFGENRAAELSAKAPRLPADITWHFIGSLQTRQAKVAAPHTSLLHSMDRTRLVNAWMAGDSPSPVLVQVNVAGEEQKHGVTPEDAVALLDRVVESGIECRGLMTIPPLAVTAEDNRKWFVRLRGLRDRLRIAHPQLAELSMGMTDDFEIAIEEGATMIRVGRAIFGPPGVPARND